MSGMAWILLGALVVALMFFALVFAQILSIESRLRELVVATESRIAVVYGLRLSPPGEESQTDAVVRGNNAAEGDEE